MVSGPEQALADKPARLVADHACEGRFTVIQSGQAVPVGGRNGQFDAAFDLKQPRWRPIKVFCVHSGALGRVGLRLHQTVLCIRRHLRSTICRRIRSIPSIVCSVQISVPLTHLLMYARSGHPMGLVRRVEIVFPFEGPQFRWQTSISEDSRGGRSQPHDRRPILFQLRDSGRCFLN